MLVQSGSRGKKDRQATCTHHQEMKVSMQAALSLFQSLYIWATMARCHPLWGMVFSHQLILTRGDSTDSLFKSASQGTSISSYLTDQVQNTFRISPLHRCVSALHL